VENWNICLGLLSGLFSFLTHFKCKTVRHSATFRVRGNLCSAICRNDSGTGIGLKVEVLGSRCLLSKGLEESVGQSHFESATRLLELRCNKRLANAQRQFNKGSENSLKSDPGKSRVAGPEREGLDLMG
jgi:hypothetical protein